MATHFATKTIEDVLDELSAVAEKEISERLLSVAFGAVEKSKDQILEDVTSKYKAAVHARLVKCVSSDSMEVQYSIKLKGENKK